MKSLIISLLLTMSALTFAADPQTVSAQKAGSDLQILDVVTNVTRTYSSTAGLDAKVIEVLYGDGTNASRMIVVLNDGYGDSKIFELGEMMVTVKRITFLAKDKLVINYVQDDFKADEEVSHQVDRSITLKILKNADGKLADTIEILN